MSGSRVWCCAMRLFAGLRRLAPASRLPGLSLSALSKHLRALDVWPRPYSETSRFTQASPLRIARVKLRSASSYRFCWSTRRVRCTSEEFVEMGFQ